MMFRVHCDDCELDEEYSGEGVAIGRRLAHIDIFGHSTHITGDE